MDQVPAGLVPAGLVLVHHKALVAPRQSPLHSFLHNEILVNHLDPKTVSPQGSDDGMIASCCGYVVATCLGVWLGSAAGYTVISVHAGGRVLKLDW